MGRAEWVGAKIDEQSETELWFKIGDEKPICFKFEDTLRKDTPKTIKALKDMGFEVEILSGDRNIAVEKAAKEAGIENYRAQLSPFDKAARLDELKAQGKNALMVGDGLNDAPSLSLIHIQMCIRDRTNSGEIGHAYIEGLKFNETLDARAKQSALGWSMELGFQRGAGGDALFVATLKDRDGKPVTGAIMNGKVARLVESKDDKTLAFKEVEPGKYSAHLNALEPGKWDFSANAVKGNLPKFETETRLSIRQIWKIGVARLALKLPSQFQTPLTHAPLLKPKRMVVIPLNFWCAAQNVRAALGVLRAVSYTHLDVYKRQY